MRVCITEPIHKDAVALLERHAEVVQCGSKEAGEIISKAQGCDAILVRVAEITSEVMVGVKSIRAVAKHGVGVDNIDVAHATKQGILVLNAPYSNVNAVAEHALAMILDISKNMSRLDKLMRETGFKHRSEFTNTELAGKTAGLVGFGKIAQLLAKKLSCMDVKICAYDPFASADAAAAAHRDQPSLCGFEQVLPSAMGRLFEEEFCVIASLMEKPERPCLFVLGGGALIRFLSGEELPVVKALRHRSKLK